QRKSRQQSRQKSFSSLSEFSHRFFFGLLHDVGQFYCRSTLPFAYVGGFHEGKQLQRLFAFDGWTPRLEESCNLLDERLVAFVFAGLSDAVFAEDGCAVVALAGANAAEGADAAVGPGADD